MAEVARRLGLPPMPHQQHIFDVAFEIDPDTGGYWYSEIDVFVMRQVGKTMGILFPVMVHRCTVVPHRLGRQLASFTMQKRDKARKKLEIDMIPTLEASPDFLRIKNPKGRPSRSTKQWKSSLNNGSEHLQFGAANYLHIGTPSADSGHGDTLDLGVADEIRFYENDQVEAGYRPSQSTRASSQIWLASTAGNEKSFYMWPKVLMGREAVEQGRESRTAFFEYSLPADADLSDPDVWYEYHPAVGRTQTLEFIMGELDKAARSPEEGAMDTFRQEYANQWVRVPPLTTGPREHVIAPELWAARAVPEHTAIVGDVALAVDVSPAGRTAAIAVAGRGADGVPIVDVLSFAADTFWVEPRVADHRDTWGPRMIGYGPGSAEAMAPEIGRAAGVVPVKKVPPGDYSAACEAFVLAVKEDRVRHLDQAWLNSAVDGATKKASGARWVWDRETALSDISPLVACTVALRLLETLEPVEPQRAPRIWSFANTRE